MLHLEARLAVLKLGVHHVFSARVVTAAKQTRVLVFLCSLRTVQLIRTSNERCVNAAQLRSALCHHMAELDEDAKMTELFYYSTKTVWGHLKRLAVLRSVWQCSGTETRVRTRKGFQSASPAVTLLDWLTECPSWS